MAVEIGPLDGQDARDEIRRSAAILPDAVEARAPRSASWPGTRRPITRRSGGRRRRGRGRADDPVRSRARGGAIVGTAQLQLIGKPNQPHRAEIAKVLVHSRARRQGLGAALMHAAEALARRAGRDLLVLDTDEASAARRLYARLGWTELGTIPRYALMPDGCDCASTFFYKDLR